MMLETESLPSHSVLFFFNCSFSGKRPSSPKVDGWSSNASNKISQQKKILSFFHWLCSFGGAWNHVWSENYSMVCVKLKLIYERAEGIFPSALSGKRHSVWEWLAFLCTFQTLFCLISQALRPATERRGKDDEPWMCFTVRCLTPAGQKQRGTSQGANGAAVEGIERLKKKKKWCKLSLLWS